MDVKTYRAKTMQDALALVRRELGAGASVLHTRAVEPSGWMRWLGSERMIEVVASATISAPSRIATRRRAADRPPAAGPRSHRQFAPIAGIDLSTMTKDQIRPNEEDDDLLA